MAFNITQIVGKKLTKKQTYSSELRSTSTVFNVVDVSSFGEKSILIKNKLNESVSISFYDPEGYVLSYWDGEKFTTSLENQVIIPPGTFASLSGLPIWEVVNLMDALRIRIKPLEVPTSGSLEINIYGKIN